MARVLVGSSDIVGTDHNINAENGTLGRGIVIYHNYDFLGSSLQVFLARWILDLLREPGQEDIFSKSLCQQE